MNQSYRRRGVDYQVQPNMKTLPSTYYTDESIFEQEKEHIFYKRWIMACREEELPMPGDFVVVPVCDESMILVRGKDGGIYAHFNVCRHRGTQMCAADKGHFEGNAIRCPYHSWTYALDGRLTAAPLMAQSPGFDPASNALFSAHVATWGGFVFVNLDENPAAFEEEMNALMTRFSDWNLPDLRIAHHLPYQLTCNWKLILQNYQECYHCPGVHPLLTAWTPFRNAVHDCMEGAVIGGFMTLNEDVKSMTMDGQAAAPPVCEVHGADLQRIHYYSIFPNMLFSPHPDFVMYHRIRPLTIDSSINDCFFLLHPDVIADSRRMERFQSAIEFWDMTNKQDWEVCEQMQKGVRSRRFTQGQYADQEDILFALDQEVLKALGHEGANKT